VAVSSPTGPLSGLVVYVSAGHGFAADRVGTGTQRSVARVGMVEDDWTAHFANHHLITDLERQGARVVSARERSETDRAMVADPTDATGATFQETPTPMLWHTDPPRYLRLAPEGTATWHLTNPNEQPAPLYVRWLPASDADPLATYTIAIDGDERTIHIDQRTEGPVDTPIAIVDGGQSATVTLTGSGQGTLSAGPARVGGGQMSIWAPADEAFVEQPAWSLAGKHIQQLAGAPSHVWEPRGAGMSFDATTRARWADWSHPATETAVLLSLHTNAGGGQGTMSFVRNFCDGGVDCTPRAQASSQVGVLIHDNIVGVMRSYVPAWQDYGVRGNDLAEINEFINPGMPGVLLEFGFHDHPVDAAYLIREDVQTQLSSAVVEGLAVWWSAQPQAMAPSGSQ